jgi:hypothetical protein
MSGVARTALGSVHPDVPQQRTENLVENLQDFLTARRDFRTPKRAGSTNVGNRFVLARHVADGRFG